MEPYKMALKWIKGEGLSQQYRDSEDPSLSAIWVLFARQDPGGRDMLLKIEADECPHLMEETYGQAVAEQVFNLPSHDTNTVPLPDTPSAGLSQQDRPYLPQVWERN